MTSKTDGTTHAEGCHRWGPRHYDCAAREIERLEREPIEYRIDSAEGSLIVVGQYCPGSAGGWLVGVAPVDNERHTQAIPPWPIRIRPGERCYSPELEIDVPDDATLRCLQIAAEGER